MQLAQCPIPSLPRALGQMSPPLQPLVSLTCLYCVPSAIPYMLEQCLAERDTHPGAANARMIIGITQTDGRSEGELLPLMKAGGQASLLWQLEQR